MTGGGWRDMSTAPRDGEVHEDFDSLAEALIAASVRRALAGQWEPIATAPQTGELFEAGWRRGDGEVVGVTPCRWADEVGAWVDDDDGLAVAPQVWRGRPLGGTP